MVYAADASSDFSVESLINKIDPDLSEYPRESLLLTTVDRFPTRFSITIVYLKSATLVLLKERLSMTSTKASWKVIDVLKITHIPTAHSVIGGTCNRGSMPKQIDFLPFISIAKINPNETCTRDLSKVWEVDFNKRKFVEISGAGVICCLKVLED